MSFKRRQTGGFLPVGSNSCEGGTDALSLLGFLSGGWSLLRILPVLCAHTHTNGKKGHHHRHIMLFLSSSTQKLDRKFGSTYKRSHSCPMSKNRPRESRQNISDQHNANYCSLWIHQLQKSYHFDGSGWLRSSIKWILSLALIWYFKGDTFIDGTSQSGF